MLTLQQKFKLIGLSLGIFTCYTIFGLLQESIFQKSYGGESFDYSFGFVGLQFIIYALFAKGYLIFTRAERKVEATTFYYFWIALFIAISMVTANMALAHISYPTQVIAKSSKPIPVMLLGVLIGKKSYLPRKYLFVFMIVLTVAMFLYKDKHKDKDGANQLIGLLLIGSSLLTDGLAGAVQDRLRSFSKPSSMDFMYDINVWCSAVVIAALAATGEARDMFLFMQRHPTIIWQLSLTVLVGTAGQVFISSMITSFGSLSCSIVTTLRKFFTVLLSVFIHNNVLSLRQWIATVVLFSVLLLDSYLNKESKPKPESIVHDEETTVGLNENNCRIIVKGENL